LLRRSDDADHRGASENWRQIHKFALNELKPDLSFLNDHLAAGNLVALVDLARDRADLCGSRIVLKRGGRRARLGVRGASLAVSNYWALRKAVCFRGRPSLILGTKS
jgi:hypothetical protein